METKKYIFYIALTHANMNKVYEVYVDKRDNILYYVLLLKHYAAEVASVIATQTPQYVWYNLMPFEELNIQLCIFLWLSGLTEVQKLSWTWVLHKTHIRHALRYITLCVFVNGHVCLTLHICVYSGLSRKERSEGPKWIPWHWSEYYTTSTKCTQGSSKMILWLKNLH